MSKKKLYSVIITREVGTEYFVEAKSEEKAKNKAITWHDEGYAGGDFDGTVLKVEASVCSASKGPSGTTPGLKSVI